jgi:hypothetical protein
MIASGQNCRASVRHQGVVNRARIEWWEGGEIRGSVARLVDLSAGGALLIAEDPPPLRQTVWCCLEAPASTDWIKANVVRHGQAREVGLSFSDSCPTDFTLAATLGLDFNPLFHVEGGAGPWED